MLTWTLAALLTGGAQSTELPSVTPVVREVVTDSDLRIWSFPDDGGDRFLLMVLVGAGSRHEAPPRTGVAHLLEHVVLASTQSTSKRDSTRALEDRGGWFNGFTTCEVTTYYISCNPAHWEFAVEWLAEHVVTPALNAVDVAEEQKIVYEEVNSLEPHAGGSTIEEDLYPDHALGKSIGGDKRLVRKLDVGDVEAFYGAHYRTPNMAVGFAGRVEHEEVFAAIESAFAGLSDRGDVADSVPVDPKLGRTLLGDRIPLQGPGWVVAGYHLPAGSTSDTAVQMHVEQYLSTRLFDEVREARQLSYGPSASLSSYSDTVRLQVNVEVSDPRNLQTVMDVLDELVLELQEPDTKTLASANQSLRNAFQVNSPDDLGTAMQRAWLARRAGESPTDLQRELTSVTATEVSSYAKEHLVPERSFAISNAPLRRFKAQETTVLLALAVMFFLLDGVRGFPWTLGVRNFLLRIRTRKRKRSDRRPSPPVISFRPAEVDELERNFQDYFEDVDRSSDP